MWVEKRKNGTYMYRERIKDVTGKIKTISVTLDDKNKKLATEILKRKKLKEESFIDLKISFFTALDMYLEKVQDDIKVSTYKLYKSRISKTKKTDFDTPLLNVNATYINMLIKKIAKTNNTYNIYLKFYKRALREMYKLDYLQDITWIDKLGIKEHQVSYDGKYFELEQIKKILDEIKDNQYYHDLIDFLFNSGLRIGEALALTEEDIIEEGTLRVNKTLDQFGNVHEPKTYESNRVISLNKKCQDILKNRIKVNTIMASMTSNYINNNLIFPKKNGTHNSYSNISQWTRINIQSYKFTFHMTRHTHASLCLDANIPIELISARLGHKGTEITRKVYIHKTKKAKQKELEIFKDITF